MTILTAVIGKGVGEGVGGVASLTTGTIAREKARRRRGNMVGEWGSDKLSITNHSFAPNHSTTVGERVRERWAECLVAVLPGLNERR